MAEVVEDTDLQHIYQLYDAALHACGAVDFDDLLLLAYQLFELRPAIASFYRRQFRYICVDEAQDLNEAQYRVLCALCSKDYFNIMMVGDPKQAIFMWNGAHPKYLDLFERDFKAKRIELRENFRSSQAVIAAAQALSPEYIAKDVFPIPGEVRIFSCQDETAEATFVANQITTLVEHGHPDVENPITWERCAVLGRNKFVFAAIEREFHSCAIDFYRKLAAGNVESGSDLVAQFELALRVLANPLDRLHVALLAKQWKAGASADDVYQNRDLRELTGMDVLNILKSRASGEYPGMIFEAIGQLQWTPTDFKLGCGLKSLEHSAKKLDDEIRTGVPSRYQRMATALGLFRQIRAGRSAQRRLVLESGGPGNDSTTSTAGSCFAHRAFSKRDGVRCHIRYWNERGNIPGLPGEGAFSRRRKTQCLRRGNSITATPVSYLSGTEDNALG